MNDNNSQEEDFSKLSLDDRMTHKSWKARVSAYQELDKLFNIDDTNFKQYSETLKNMLGDSNIVAQEAAVTALLSFVTNAPNPSIARSTLVPIIIDKYLASTRSGTRSRALSVLLMYIEVEGSDSIVEELINGLSHKTPKVVAASTNALKESVRLFGVKVVNPKSTLKRLPKIFDHKDKNVRKEATLLAIELYKYLGPSLSGFLSDLKPVQLKELNEEFEKLGECKPKPERLLRSEQIKQASLAEQDDAAGGENTQGSGDTEEKDNVADAYDLADSIDLCSKIPSNFYDDLAAKKWQVRKEALANLYTVLEKTTKIEDGNYGELLNALGKRIADANIVVAISAINCIEKIARGLRSNFISYKSMVTPALIEKCKEKKVNCVEAVKGALDAIFAAYLVFNETLVEDMINAGTHKNPQVKANGILWMVRSLCLVRKAPVKSEVKALTEMLLKAIDDSDVNVRAAAAEGLGTLLKVVGEKSIMNTYLEKLDAIKMGKVKDACEKATVKATAGKGARAPSKAAPVAAPPAKKSNKENRAPVAKKSMANLKSKASTASISTAAAAETVTPSQKAPPVKPKAASSKAAAVKLDMSTVHSDESAEEVIRELMQPSTPVPQDSDLCRGIEDLGNSNWKKRLVAIQTLEKLETDDTEALYRTLLKKPSFKENNFQVMNAMMNVLNCVNQVTPGVAELIIPRLSEKLGDLKVKKAAGDCLLFLAESTTWGFVLSTMIPILAVQKSPKVLSDSTLFISNTLKEFGIAGVDIKGLVEFTKLCFKNTNGTVRNNAVGVITVLRQFVGEGVRGMLNDLNTNLLTIIDGDYKKVEGVTAPTPTRTSALLAPRKAKATTAMSVAPSAKSTEAIRKPAKKAPSVEEEDDLDDVFPRVDISSQISDTTLENVKDASWKIRKEGLDAIMQVVKSANNRIQPNFGNELLPALKGRLSDANKNLVMLTLEICSLLCSSIGRSFDKHVRIISGNVVACLGDNKIQVRAAALKALDVFYNTVGFEPLVQAVGQSLMNDQPILRKDLLRWVSGKLQDETSDLAPLTHPTLLCLQDRNSDVRKTSTNVLQCLINVFGTPYIRDKASEHFQGTQLSTVMTVIDGCKSTKGSAESVTAPQSSIPARPTTPSKARSSRVQAKEEPKKKPLSRSTSVSRVDTTPDVSSAKKAPVLTSDPKAKTSRADRDKGLTKWTFESPRKELVDFLQDQCSSNFSAEVCEWMFSTSHYKEKDNISALAALIDAIGKEVNCEEEFGVSYEELKSRFICNADLIFKYITLRFYDTNTSILLKCLDLLEGLFALMDESGYHLSDYEASCFLPFFINKTGDNKETMRVKMRAIMKQICRVYPSSKLFTFIVKGLESKNARTRVECLEELALLVQRNGLDVSGNPSKTFPVIAAQISDRDANVRNGAISVIAQAYRLVGEDQVFKLVGTLPAKDKSLLVEKFKRLPAAMSPPVEKMSADSKPSLIPEPSKASVVQKEVSEQAASPEESTNNAADTDVPVRKEFSLDFDKFDFTQTTSVSSADAAPIDLDALKFTPEVPSLDVGLDHKEIEMMDFIINQITASDSDMSINACKHLEKTLNANPKALAPYMDDIVTAIIVQIRLSFTNIDVGDSSISRLCKYLVNMLVQLFSDADLPKSLRREPMSQCIKELLNRLVDPKLSTVENGSQLSKALNVLMVRIMENCNRSKSFSCLLETLETSSQNIKDCKPDKMSHQSKYIELVMKCLWKMTKIIPQLIESDKLEVSELVLDVHNFLTSSPPSEWKARGLEKKIPQADMPLRTIKTILHELTGALDVKIFDHLDLIPNLHSSHAVSYIRQMVENRRKKQGRTSPILIPGLDTGVRSGGMVTAASTLEKAKPKLPHPFSEISSPLRRPTPSVLGSSRGELLPESEVRSKLTAILAKIRDKDQTKEGISDLYAFKKTYADVDAYVDEYVNNTGPYFQGYIRRGLQALQDAESSESPDKQPTRRPYSMLATPTGSRSSSMTLGANNARTPYNPYKERLERIQQQFRGNTEDADEESTSIDQGKKSSRPLSYDSALSPLKNAASPSSSSARNSLANSSSDRGESQSYEALKERLNRMKMNMSKK